MSSRGGTSGLIPTAVTRRVEHCLRSLLVSNWPLDSSFKAEPISSNLPHEHPVSLRLLPFDASMCVPIQAADQQKEGEETDNEA